MTPNELFECSKLLSYLFWIGMPAVIAAIVWIGKNA